jgi:hypothetical protein
MSNAALERMLFTPPGFVAERLRPEPDWAHIRGLGCHRPGVRLVGHLVARHSDFDWLKPGGLSRGNSPCWTSRRRERG